MAGKWPLRPLGDLTENLDSIRVPVKEAARRAGPYPYYGASGVVDHVDGYLFDGEYLLIAEDGENLKTRHTPVAFLARGKFWVNNHAHIVRGNAEADTRFLMYALADVDISGYLTGSTMPKLTQGNLNRISVPTPPLDQQRAIAHILGTLDDKIELNQRMNETLEGMARLLFKSWFVDFDPVRAKAEGHDPRLPTHLADLFPNSLEEYDLGKKPKAWKSIRLSDVCDYISSGGTPNTQVPDYWGGGIPWLSSGETRNRFIVSTDKKITAQGVDNSSTRLARARSTVIAGAGQGHTRGQTSLLMFDSYINQSVVALAANHRAISDLYLFFNLDRRYEEFRQMSDSHSSRGSLTTKLLGSLSIIVPPQELVEKFDEYTKPLVERIHKNLHQSVTLAALRNTLLPKLISGALRLKHAERIAVECGL